MDLLKKVSDKIIEDEYYDKSLKLLESSFIRGVVFSIYDEMGPDTLYNFPKPRLQEGDIYILSGQEEGEYRSVNEGGVEGADKWDKMGIEGGHDRDDWAGNEGDRNGNAPNKSAPNKSAPDGNNLRNDINVKKREIKKLTQRNYLQISIKSFSLLIGEKIFERDNDIKDQQYSGVIPYPDLDICAYSFFRFYEVKNSTGNNACTFSLLVDNSNSDFIYNNIEIISILVKNVVGYLVRYLYNNEWVSDTSQCHEIYSDVNRMMYIFFRDLVYLEKHKILPIISERPIKVLFLGLKNSGKSSFLSILNRRYSELIEYDLSGHIEQLKIATTLGLFFIVWDLKEHLTLKELDNYRYKILFNDSDIIFYFIEPFDKTKIKMSLECFKIFLEYLYLINKNIPIVVIITKIEKDIKTIAEIKDNIKLIKDSARSIAGHLGFTLDVFQSSIIERETVFNSFKGGFELLIPQKNSLKTLFDNFLRKINGEGILFFNEKGIFIMRYERMSHNKAQSESNRNKDATKKRKRMILNYLEDEGLRYIETYASIEVYLHNQFGKKLKSSRNFLSQINKNFFKNYSFKSDSKKRDASDKDKKNITTDSYERINIEDININELIDLKRVSRKYREEIDFINNLILRFNVKDDLLFVFNKIINKKLIGFICVLFNESNYDERLFLDTRKWLSEELEKIF
ncbi:MAG: ADP-ribosylation factor-like protein [Promethearchaeota archaeon]